MSGSEEPTMNDTRAHREVPATCIEEVLALARYAHSLRPSESNSVSKWLAEAVEAGKRIFGVYDAEATRLLACWMLHPYTMRLRDSLVSMGGLGLVSSRPDQRGRGNVRFMMTRAIETMRETGHAVSVLYPFHIDFYRKYGWESFTEWMRYEFSPGTLGVPDHDHQVVTQELSFADEASQAFYNDYARAHYNFALRDDIHWKSRFRLWDDEQIASGLVKAERQGRVVGLMGYKLFHRHTDHDPVLNISLFAAGDASAKQALLAYLKRQSHQVKKIELHLPKDEALWPYLDDYASAIKLQQLAMIRIIDLAMLDCLQVAAPDTVLRIEVMDPQAAWNNGRWTLTVQDGVLHVEQGGVPVLQSGIGPLSAVLSGFANVAEMLACAKMKALPGYHDEDLPKETTLLVDFF